MKRKSIYLVLCLSVTLLLMAGCTDSEIADAADSLTQAGEDMTDQIENLTDAEEPNVLGIKNACPEDYPTITYGEAFENFFAYPTWNYFIAEDGEEVVEFTGRCTYLDATVKAVLQFILNEDGKTFTIGALSFNDVPQDLLTEGALLEKVFEEYSENDTDTSQADGEKTNTDNSADMESNGNGTDNKADTVTQDMESLVGSYSRGVGPKCGLSIWSADDKGISFAMGIGSSGYLAYVDMRDCLAEWTTPNTAVYTEEYGNRHYVLTFTVNEGGLTLSENQPYSEDFPLSGDYISDSIAEDHCEFVFPEDDIFPLDVSELEGKTAVECKIARNEIYARHGRRFNDEQLQGYFDICSWYKGTISPEAFSDGVLNELEKSNLQVISEYESKMGYR